MLHRSLYEGCENWLRVLRGTLVLWVELHANEEGM